MTHGSPLMLRSRAARLAALLAAAAACAGLVACGEDEEEAIRDAVVAYGEAEGDSTCDFLSASALDQLGGESGCSRTLAAAPSAELEVQEITVDGDTATASVRNVETGTPFELELVRQDGEWKVSSFPGLADFPSAPSEPPPQENGEGGDTETAPGDEPAETDEETETDGAPAEEDETAP